MLLNQCVEHVSLDFMGVASHNFFDVGVHDYNEFLGTYVFDLTWSKTRVYKPMAKVASSIVFQAYGNINTIWGK